MQKQKLFSALLVLSIGAAGCAKDYSNSASTQIGAKTAAGNGHGQADDKPFARTVKTGAGLRFFHQMQRPVQANSPHSVTLSIGHDYPGQNLELTATADDGISLAANRHVTAMVLGRDAEWTIPFTARADGVYYINVTGTVAVPGRPITSRVYSVRVEVGEQKPAEKPSGDEGILQADEKIY